jgi:hypothetical protein
VNRFLLVALAFIGVVGLAQAPASAENVADRMIESRAAEAAIWGMPAVNYDLMRQEMLTKTAGKENQVIYWGRPADWKNQTLTPNPDTLYFMTFLNTKDAGPMVIDIPPASAEGSVNANFVNIWQQPLADAGPLGDDKGAGAKLLMLPPGYAGRVPAGYVPLQPNTYGSYALIRSNLKSHSDADVATSASYAKQVKVYPLSQAANPPATIFTDVQSGVFDSTIRYDASFFTNLNRIIQDEPWLDRDRAMIDQLRTLGIEKGKAFVPNDATKQALAAGISDAHTWLAAKYDAGLPPFFDGTHWTYPTLPDMLQAMTDNWNTPNLYPTDARGLAYTYGFIAIKKLGAGQFYLLNIKDKDGANYDGSKNYRLHVPPNVPVEQYWSLTAYDRETHALIKNVARASRASNDTAVVKNPDGSVDLYIGPKAPAGKEANWIPTDPARGFEFIFRLYAPTKPLFDKTWTMPDIEKAG